MVSTDKIPGADIPADDQPVRVMRDGKIVEIDRASAEAMVLQVREENAEALAALKAYDERNQQRTDRGQSAAR